MEGYQNLIIWQKAMMLAKETYIVIHTLPKKEQYGLISQMQRAAISIPSNIAEGYGRATTPDFIHFLSIARGSKNELETQVRLCIMLGYLTEESAGNLLQLCIETGKLLNAAINKLGKEQ